GGVLGPAWAKRLAVEGRTPYKACLRAAAPACDIKPGNRRAHGLGIDVDAALPVMRRDRRFHEVFGKAQSQLAEALAVGCVSVDLGRVAVVEAGEVPAIVARPSGMNLLRERLELNGVRPIG